MKINFRWLLLLTFVFGCVAGSRVKIDLNEALAAEGEGWKYKCQRFTGFGGPSIGEIESWLNKMGSHGWELATTDAGLIYCMKKKI